MTSIQPRHSETITIPKQCKHCQSMNVIKYGNKGGNQYYKCLDCNRKHSDNDSFVGMKMPKELIGNAIQLYYGGIAATAMQEHLKSIYGMSVYDSTIWRWVQKYSKMGVEFLYQYPVELSDTWCVDETQVKVNKEPWWFWDVIDRRTRFLVATHMSRTRTINDAVQLFKKCKWRAKTKPRYIYSDGLQGYTTAINKAFYARKKKDATFHVVIEGITEDININILERWHGSLKQRNKTMRGLKRWDCAKVILQGWTLHYNFFKNHESIGNIPPARAAGLNLPFDNWVGLIQYMEDMGGKPVKNPIPHWGDLEAI